VNLVGRENIIKVFKKSQHQNIKYYYRGKEAASLSVRQPGKNFGREKINKNDGGQQENKNGYERKVIANTGYQQPYPSEPSRKDVVAYQYHRKKKQVNK